MSYQKLICMTVTLLFLLTVTVPLGAWDGNKDGFQSYDNRGHPWQDDNQYVGDESVQTPRITIIIAPFIKAINIELPFFLKKIFKKKVRRNNNTSTSRNRLERRVSLKGADTR